jgi:hypothetical protein
MSLETQMPSPANYYRQLISMTPGWAICQSVEYQNREESSRQDGLTPLSGAQVQPAEASSEADIFTSVYGEQHAVERLRQPLPRRVALWETPARQLARAWRFQSLMTYCLLLKDHAASVTISVDARRRKG